MDNLAVRDKTANRLTSGYLICLAGTALLSTTAIFIRYLNNAYQLPPLVLAFWRDLFVLLGLVLFFALANPVRLRVERRHLVFLIAYGLLVAVFNSLWTLSVALNGAAVATVLAYSSAAFTALLGWQLLGEKLGPAKLTAVALSLAGCLFVSGAYTASAWRVNLTGILAGLSSGLAYAGYSLMGRSAAHRGINAWSTLLYAFGFASGFLLLYNLASGWIAGSAPSGDLFWLGSSWTGWSVLLALSLGPTIGGFGLYTLSLGYLPASVANLIATLEPAMTSTFAYLLLGERLSLPQLFGSALIILGVIILRIREEM